VDLVVTGDPSRARATVAQEMAARGFRLTWADEWTAVAERGSKGANVALGALAQYFKVGLRVMSAGTGNSIVRLETLSSGWMGGAIGAHRTTTNFDRLRDDLWRTFYDAGVLVTVNQG
jgi:hypothetical protein